MIHLPKHIKIIQLNMNFERHNSAECFYVFKVSIDQLIFVSVTKNFQIKMGKKVSLVSRV